MKQKTVGERATSLVHDMTGVVGPAAGLRQPEEVEDVQIHISIRVTFKAAEHARHRKHVKAHMVS